MAYINAEQVAEKRKALKSAFPGWKFSVRNRHHSSIDVAVLSAPYDLTKCYTGEHRDPDRNYVGVNHHHVDRSFNGRAVKDLKKMISIINAGNYDNSDIQTDYFDVGFYVDLSIGRWDKPFQVKSS